MKSPLAIIPGAFSGFASRIMTSFKYGATIEGSELKLMDKTLETRRLSDLLIFFMIPVMHVCYGAGEWTELFRPGRDLSVASEKA